MPNIASVSLTTGPQRARPAVSSMPNVILLGLALLITACTDGGNDTIRNADTAIPAPAPTPVPPPAPTSFTLVVAKTGTGTITSSPSGIACGTTCSNSYVGNTNVTLTAAPASGNTFSGWSGACAGAATTCVLSMTVNRSVSATFAPIAGGTGTATVSWTAPSNRVSGVSMTPNELAGYKIYYGTSLGDYPDVVDVPDKTATAYTLSGLVANATYYMVVTSYDTFGKESANSNVVMRTP